jgi:hypothetical protein
VSLAGLESSPQAQMAIALIQKTFFVLRPLEEALTCSILIAGPQIMFKKRIFLGEGPG